MSHIIGIVLLPAAETTLLAQKWNYSNASTIMTVEGF